MYKSKIEITRTCEDDINFRGTFHHSDMPELDNFDEALLIDCSLPDATPADWLLALECLFRRAQEQSHV